MNSKKKKNPSNLPCGFCSCSFSSASLSSASGRSILFTTSKAGLDTSSSLYNSSSLEPWWERRDGEGKVRETNAKKNKKSFMLSVSPWWEVERHQRPTYMVFYSPTGNHKHLPAARNIKLHHHRQLSSSYSAHICSSAYVLCVTATTHHKQQLLGPLHMFQELVAHAFV